MSSLDFTENLQGTTPRTAALVAGLGLLAMTVIAGVANFAIIQNMVISGDAQATATNLMGSAGLFRLGAVALALVAVLDVLVAWGLYELLKQVNAGISLVGGWLRVAYAAIFAVSITSIFASIRAAPTDAAAALRLAEQFNDGWMVGQIFFGAHLAVVGYLALRSRFIHWVFGALLVVAGSGYFADGIIALVVPESTLQLAMFTFVGEVLFIFWLLIRGTRLPMRVEAAQAV
jgi:hypothetical protein